MSDVMDRPRTIPMKPPAARAPAVLQQRPGLERELADLKQQIGQTTLAAFEVKPDGRKNLMALAGEIHTVTFQLEAAGAAHQLAKRLDAEAVAAWFAALQDNPKAAVEGITKTECCKRCTEAHGCAITGGLQCGHPVAVGSVGPALMGNPKVRAVFVAASTKLKIGIYK
jgi:hypothetical protein